MGIRRVSILAVVTAASLAIAACGGGGDPAAGPVADAPQFPAGSTMARIAEAGTLRAGVKFDQAGFGMTGLSDKPAGFEVELVKMIAAKLGVKEENIQYTEAPARVREEIIERKEVDLVAATYTINDERKKRISFAGPYYLAGQQVMVAKDDNKIDGPQALRNDTAAKVCSTEGSVPSERIKPYLANPDQLVLFDVNSKCADALRTGQIRAVTSDNVILLGLVSKSNGAFKLVGERFSDEPYGIGIAKGDVQFCEFINQVLREAAQSGAYEKAWTSTAGKLADNVETPALPSIGTCS
ncbi:glutamate ABC transporter substrate-binding protein [Micromonospora cremea]|uniref:Glutamate transport system substrate-binding protein n=1 Tax=Micromonospora cremea TaxID=709881 RepID=A0A1N5UHA2_9ACTN|nr:glutamate ABC transporter substrate-binding protein [Micromonospora cremea]SIM59419.1 glutamate transport system substrate-binding protein [Micromonospora cremea]